MGNEEKGSEKKYVECDGRRKIESGEKSENEKKRNIDLEREKEERKKRGRENERMIFSTKKHHVYPVTFSCDFLKTTNAVFDVGKCAIALAISGDVTPLYIPPCKEASLGGDMTLSLSTLFEVGGATDVLKPP
ncbi:unnamed protein product [Amaranthus hypochondriacus]